jgi:uncharacterized protein (TIGR03067 family)
MGAPLFVLFIAGSVTIIGVGKDKTAEQDLKRLQGDWRVRSLEVHVKGGTVTPKAELEKWRWVIKGNSLTWISPAGPDQKDIFSLHPSRSPKWIDLTGKVEIRDVDKNGKLGDVVQTEQWTLYGIYELKGDTLRVCLPLGQIGSKVRPAEFTGKEGSGCMLYSLERMQAKKRE